MGHKQRMELDYDEVRFQIREASVGCSSFIACLHCSTYASNRAEKIDVECLPNS